jgi:hypothetical protein
MYYESIFLDVQRLIKVERWPRRLKFSAVFEVTSFSLESTTHQHHDLTGGKAIKHRDLTCLHSSLISSTCKLKKMIQVDHSPLCHDPCIRRTRRRVFWRFSPEGAGIQ